MRLIPSVVHVRSVAVNEDGWRSVGLAEYRWVFGGWWGGCGCVRG
jgi:hypothetical protein